VFCVDLRKKGTTSLSSTNCLVFITERESVYCGVRAESLNKIQVTFSHNMTCRTVGRRASSEVQFHLPGGILSDSQFAFESAKAYMGDLVLSSR